MNYIATNNHLTKFETSGLEVLDLDRDEAHALRPANPHGMADQMEAMQRLVRAFVESPGTILQELVDVAVELCGADSAGISLEKQGGTDKDFYHWIATAGAYSNFRDAMLPRYPSACGICLERGRPQRFRVGQPFFDILGVQAPLVTDGILLPWRVEDSQGTIFVMAHGRSDAFDAEDCRMMQVLADFAALGVRQQRQQDRLIQQAGAAAAAAMANGLAHKINNPLQSLTNILYMASEGYSGEGARVVGEQALADVERLSTLVKRLLSLPYSTPDHDAS